MLDEITRSSEKRPYTVIAIVGLITAGMIYGATQVSMSSEMEKFLPQDYTSVKVSNMVENEAGSAATEIILLEGDDLSSPNAFRSIDNLRSELHFKFENYIVRVESYPSYLIPGLKEIAKNRFKTENWRNIPNRRLGPAIQKLLSRPRLRKQTNALLTEKSDAALVTVFLNSQLSEQQLKNRTKDLEKHVQRFGRDHEEFSAEVTGMISMGMDTKGMMNRDNQILIPAAIVVVVVVLYLAFRRLSDTGAPFLILGLGALWMVGTMGFLGIPFTMVYVALVPIILGIGIDYTIHMLNRYYEERGEGLRAGKSAVLSVKTVGVAIALTAITTAIGFGSFGTSDMPPIQNFGFLAAAGVLFIFGLATTLLPSFLTLRDRGKEKEKKESKRQEKDRIGTGLSKIETGIQEHKKPILVGAVVISVLCAIPASGLTTTMNFDTFLPKGVDSVNTMEKVEDHFGGQERAYIVGEGTIASPKSLKLIKDLENSVTSDPKSKNLIVKSSSLTDLILYSENRIPKNRTQIENALSNLENERPKQLNRLLIERNKTVIYFSIAAETDKQMEEAAEIMRTHVENFAKRPDVKLDLTIDGEPAVGGGPPIISDILGSIIPSMRNSIILAIILVGVVLALIFRSALLGLIGTLPVSLALLWELGALGGLNWSLDVMNMMVSAIAIGIGVDFAIHITHRFREEGEENGKSPEKAISITIQSVGRAISAAAATTIGVFVVLSLSRMPPVVRFGQLSAMVIFFALVGALVVLPSVLLAHAKWRGK